MKLIFPTESNKPEIEDLMKHKGIISDMFFQRKDESFQLWLDNNDCIRLIDFILDLSERAHCNKV